MDTKLTSNLFTIIIVLAVLSWLINEDKISHDPIVATSTLNTLTTQKIFRQCGNSLGSNLTCVKLVDDLAQGVISKDEFLNYIKHADSVNQVNERSPSNSL